jgi:polyferredoxin
MTKLGRPTRLIAYDTDQNIRARMEGKPQTAHIVRPRTLLYTAIIVIVGAVMLYALATRVTTSINVIHDRNPEYVVLSDGGVRNAYTLRVLNKHTTARTFAFSVDLPESKLEIVGAEPRDGQQVAEVGPDQTRELRAIVSVDHGVGDTRPIRFTITDTADGSAASATDNFRGPGEAQ